MQKYPKTLKNVKLPGYPRLQQRQLQALVDRVFDLLDKRDLGEGNDWFASLAGAPRAGKHLAQNTSEHSVHWNPSPGHVLSHAAHSELSPPIFSRYGPRTSRHSCPKTSSAGDTTIQRSGLGSKTVITSLAELNCLRSCSMPVCNVHPVCQSA